MVIRLIHARSGVSNSTGVRGTEFGATAGKGLFQLPRDRRSVNSQDIDCAIAQVASGLRILLNIGLHSDGDNLKLRSGNMGTEASSISVNDRYDVLVVENYEDGAGAEKASWTRVGVAFAHKDGNGLNVELRAIPVSGKLVIRRHDAKSRASER